MKRVLALGALAVVAFACARPQAQQGSVVVLPSVVAERPLRPSFVGAGSLEAHGEKTAKTKLAIERLAVSAETSGDVAEVAVEHVFRNDADEQLEGTFRFPLPEGSMLVGLAMEMDGRMVDGELVERDKARKAYEETVDKMLDPALLEWENGTTFKLRVFPIEAKKTKRVVLRFIAPLHRADDGLYFAFRPPTGDGGVPLERFAVKVDGDDVSAAPRTPTGEVLTRVSGAAPEAFVERTEQGAYVAATVHPTFAADAGAGPAAQKGQALVVLCDRSRSMLEARTLESRVLDATLAELDARDRFAVVTGDVKAHAMPGGAGGTSLHAPTAAERAAAVAFVDATEPDGASDLGVLLDAGAAAGAQARAAGLEPTFAYVGDATATWGETRASSLAAIARDRLGAPLHVVVLGKSTDDDAARAIASATHGRLLRPKTEDDAKRDAKLILAARTTRRIDDLHVVADDALDVPLPPPGTIYEGDDISFAAFLPKDKEANVHSVRLLGTIAGKPFEKELALASATPARDVAKRWATARIELLQRDGDAHKDDVVKTSLAQGVMSRYTSFLVLESDEAYAKYQIERRAHEDASGEARVTGRDLDGTSDGRTASVTPDHLQPGDPEIRVPAPADARSVVVVLPFGETKDAAWEDDARGGSWVARFLVDAHTPDGTYEIVIRVTHADGSVEIQKVPYVVDTQRPNLDVRVVARRGGKYEIRATQRLTEEEIAAQAPGLTGSLDEKRARTAAVLTDAKRVEVVTPDGQTLSLAAVRVGEFAGTWTPKGPVAPHAKLRIVAVDRALNERAMDVELP
jgi:hypothetical protein